ncbi:MAG TPA: HlyD family efflux transporter periplasmic adaptor subunit [Gemmatimonadales bacterium]|nr:HlyD family efflux transporter periplasmic adaptor subunit [Gemmatimonadales bacterium]
MPYASYVDIPREPVKNRRRLWQVGIGVAAIIVITLVLSSLKPAAPSIDRGTLLFDTVRIGEMVRDVHGPGTLVPEHIRFISALASARVERILAQPGQQVQAGSVLLELSNPDVQIQALQAEQQLTAAQAQLVSLRTSLENQRLTQEGVVATTKVDYQKARRDALVADTLVAHGLIAANDAALTKDRADELETRYRVEQQRLALMTSTLDSQVAVQASQVARLRAIAQFQRTRVRSLTVLAGDAGTLTDLSLQPGQWVTEGTMLAKVVQPGRLKAVLQIPETQARDVAIGQVASIDTRNGVIRGHVSRTDVNSQNGTVTVDVALEGALPQGARPDLSVDGTIVFERLSRALHTGRPAYGQANSTITMFKVTDGGRYATRVTVQVGSTSVTNIEIRRGLAVGDMVILSDMSQWDNVDRVRLK